MNGAASGETGRLGVGLENGLVSDEGLADAACWLFGLDAAAVDAFVLSGPAASPEFFEFHNWFGLTEGSRP